MSEQILEQVSAFLDGELPDSESELLLKRLTHNAELRESFGRYALIGESLRGGGRARVSRSFSGRVNRAIDGESGVAPREFPSAARTRWWRPLAGAAVAAGVAAIAVVALQQRAIAPLVGATLPMTAQSVAVAGTGAAGTGAAGTGAAGTGVAGAVAAPPREALSYTVPTTVTEVPTALPAARLTNYVFAHSQYSSVLGQSNVLSGLLSESDQEGAAGAMAKPRDTRAAP